MNPRTHTPELLGEFPGLLTKADLCRFLSWSESSLRRLRRSGRFGPEPLVFGGRLKRFSKAEVQAWIEAGCPDRRVWARLRKAEKA